MPYRCDGDARQPVWRVSGAISAVRTTLVFDDVRVRTEQVTAAASAGRFGNPRLGATLTVGGLLAGRIEGRSLGPGVLASLSGSWLVRRERRWRPGPFVLLTGSFAAVRAAGAADDGDASYTALDARAGVAIGRTRGRWTGYAAARGFGGPVWWRREGAGVTGSDRWHVTVGLGITFRIPGVLDLGAEAMPLGEQSATASATFHL
jgi:hypothetical protein